MVDFFFKQHQEVGGGGGEICLMLHCHHQNDESHFNVENSNLCRGLIFFSLFLISDV